MLNQPSPVTLDKDIERLSAISTHLKLASDLAKGPSIDLSLASKINTLSKSTRDAIVTISTILKTHPEFNETLNVTEKQKLYDLFMQHPSAVSTLISSGAIEPLEQSIKKLKKYSRIGNIFSGIGDFVNQSSYSKYAMIFPPVFLSMIFFGAVSTLTGSILKFIAEKENPDLKHKKESRIKAGLKIILSIVALIAFVISVTLAGPIVAGAIALSMTFYSLIMSGINFYNAAKLFGDFLREPKEPFETYKYRRTKKAMQCLKNLSDTVFYLCAAISWGVTLFLIINPIGLKVSAAIALVGTTASIVFPIAACAEMWTSYKINKMKGKTLNLRDSLIFFRHKTKANFIHTRSRVFSVSKKLPSKTELLTQKPAGLFLLQHAKHQRSFSKLLLKSFKKFLPDDYQKQQKSAIRKLHLIQKNVSIYKGLQYKAQSEGDSDGLEVIVPHSPSHFSQTDHTKSSHTNPAIDIMKRYRQDDNVMVTLSANPSDDTLCLFFHLNRNLAPLIMNPYGNAEMILRVMEAAKLMDVEVQIDPSDLKFFEKSDDAESEKQQKHFEALKSISSKEFEAYYKSSPGSKLGKILRNGFSRPKTEERPRT